MTELTTDATGMPVFYDAADWRQLPHGQVCLFYADGQPGGFPIPTPAQIESVEAPEYRMITSRGNGRIASVLDGKPDNNLDDATVRAFVRERVVAAEDAIIYTPRAFVHGYQRALFDGGTSQRLYDYPGLWWFIATLDGHSWTPAELAQDLAANWDALLDPSRIWANQFDQIPQLGPGATADVSHLFMAWRP